MTLSPEQKKAVAGWVAAGDNLATIQRKLSDEFKVSMTYMDVRFLVDDLGLVLKNTAPRADSPEVAGAGAKQAAGGDQPGSPEKRGFMDKLKEKVGLGAEKQAGSPYPGDDAPDDDFVEEEPAPEGAAGKLSVEVDRVVRPGAVVSGNVTFSDGVSGKWAMDQYGRLMLETPQKGYQPSPADVQAFQRELSMQLQRQGY